MRSNFIEFLQTHKAINLGIVFKKYTYTILMPPVTSKMVKKFIENPDDNDNTKNKLKKFDIFKGIKSHSSANL